MATMAAVLEIYFALFLLNQKVNLSGSQVSNTEPSWPSFDQNIIAFVWRYILCGLIHPHKIFLHTNTVDSSYLDFAYLE